MRILHTSDWHLGRTLHGEDLHEHQERFHDWLVELVREREVDVVVIPGDVYDRAVPPTQAVQLLGRTLARLADEATVILTPGNHDSATRLGFGSSLLRAGVHILADAPGIEHPVVVPDEHGDVLFFGLPYLEPDLARFSLAQEESEPLARSHEAVTRAALERVRARTAAHAQLDGADEPEDADGKAPMLPGMTSRPRSVVLAHTFVAGGAASDSERDLSVGGVDSVPAALLHGIDYVALGHLHGCQDLTAAVARGADGAADADADADAATVDVDAAPDDAPRSALDEPATTAWYSGSPLAFSFSEKDQRKSVLLVELGAPGQVQVERIPAPVPRRLTELVGTLEEVLAAAPDHGEDWLKAVITDAARPPHLLEQLRAAYPHLLHTEHRPVGGERAAVTPSVRREASPTEVIDEFLHYVTGADPTEAEHQVVEDAYQAARARAQEAS